MLLNKAKTNFLKSLIASGTGEFTQLWMEHDSTTFPTGVVNAYGDEVDEMEAAYNENPSNLHGTNENGSTFQFTGISPFPRKPQK